MPCAAGNKKLILSALIAGTLACVLFAALKIQRAAVPAMLHKVHFAVPAFQSSALVLLALEEGYFRAEGVDAIFEFYPTGKLCLDQVLHGNADFAVVYETPTLHAASAGNPLSVITELHRSEEGSAIVSRKDRGILGSDDLKGKKIAVVPKTNAEFLLSLYLRSHMINPDLIRKVPLKVAEAVEGVRSGWVDGAALWEPYLSQAIADHPDEFTLLRSPYYSEFSLLVGKRDSIRDDQEMPYAVLRALGRALVQYEKNRKSAQRQVDNFLAKKGVLVSPEFWDKLDIHLGLSATLLTMLSEESRAIRLANSNYQKVDLTNLMRGTFLKKLQPHLVTYE